MFFSYWIHFTAMSTLNINFFFLFNFFVNVVLASPQVSFQKSIATYERNFLYYKDALFFLMDITHIEKGIFFITMFRYFLMSVIFSTTKILCFLCWLFFFAGYNSHWKGAFFCHIFFLFHVNWICKKKHELQSHEIFWFWLIFCKFYTGILPLRKAVFQELFRYFFFI